MKVMGLTVGLPGVLATKRMMPATEMSLKDSRNSLKEHLGKGIGVSGWILRD